MSTPEQMQRNILDIDNMQERRRVYSELRLKSILGKEDLVVTSHPGKIVYSSTQINHSHKNILHLYRLLPIYHTLRL